MSVDMLSEVRAKDGKPAYIEFSTVSKQLTKQSEREGRYVAIDEDRVTVRQIGSNDSVVFKVETWLSQNRVDVQQGRLNPQFEQLYKDSYKRWKEGQELPVQGTPIKTWPVLSPSQVGALIAINVRTVEDLSTLNDEGLRRVGMGAIDLKQKAQAWLAQAQDKGPLTMKMAALEKENESLLATVNSLVEKVAALQQQTPIGQHTTTNVVVGTPEITADDIMDKPVPEKRKR